MATITDANIFVDNIQDIEAFVQLLGTHFYKDNYGRLDCAPYLECKTCPIDGFCRAMPNLVYNDLIEAIKKRHIELFV